METMKYHCTPTVLTIPSFGKVVEQQGLFCTTDGNVELYNHFGKQSRGSLKSQIYLVYKSAISLLGFTEEKRAHVHTKIQALVHKCLYQLCKIPILETSQISINR